MIKCEETATKSEETIAELCELGKFRPGDAPLFVQYIKQNQRLQQFYPIY